MKTVTRKIGQNRGKPRLWLEGKLLDEAGFPHGTKWKLSHLPSPARFYIETDPEGNRKVSGKPTRPVIDISGASLGELGTAKTVLVQYEINGGSIRVMLDE